MERSRSLRTGKTLVYPNKGRNERLHHREQSHPGLAGRVSECSRSAGRARRGGIDILARETGWNAWVEAVLGIDERPRGRRCNHGHQAAGGELEGARRLSDAEAACAGRAHHQGVVESRRRRARPVLRMRHDVRRCGDARSKVGRHRHIAASGRSGHLPTQANHGRPVPS